MRNSIRRIQEVGYAIDRGHFSVERGFDMNVWYCGSQYAKRGVTVVNMDDPNITIKEYIRLEKEKARRRGQVYNWETATYVFNDALTSKVALSCAHDSENDNDKVNMPLFPSPKPTVSYFNDLDFFKDFEKEFPAIVYIDALTSK
ncbi:hypothetical protein Tco_1352899 [Tanacetum coccineum]